MAVRLVRDPTEAGMSLDSRLLQEVKKQKVVMKKAVHSHRGLEKASGRGCRVRIDVVLNLFWAYPHAPTATVPRVDQRVL